MLILIIILSDCQYDGLRKIACIYNAFLAGPTLNRFASPNPYASPRHGSQTPGPGNMSSGRSVRGGATPSQHGALFSFSKVTNRLRNCLLKFLIYSAIVF